MILNVRLFLSLKRSKNQNQYDGALFIHFISILFQFVECIWQSELREIASGQKWNVYRLSRNSIKSKRQLNVLNFQTVNKKFGIMSCSLIISTYLTWMNAATKRLN